MCIAFEYDDELTNPEELAAFLTRELEASVGGILDSHPGVIGYSELVSLDKGIKCVVNDTYDGDDRKIGDQAKPLDFEIVRDDYGIQVRA